jgi:hypothetical protein
MKMFSLIVLSIFTIVVDANVSQVDGYDSLVSAKSLKCEFGLGSTGHWSGSKLVLEQNRFDVTFHFDSIDIKTGKARLIANEGADDVTVPGFLQIGPGYTGAPAPDGDSQYAPTFDFANAFTKATDSDQWPHTWQTDDATYYTYGDGQGFEAGNDAYWGIGKCTGTPPTLTCTDISQGIARSGPLDNTIYDKKAGGIVSDGGTVLKGFWGAAGENESGAAVEAFDRVRGWVSTDNGATVNFSPTGIEDNFNRASLGSSWTNSGSAPYVISGNTLIPGDTHFEVSVYTALSLPSVQAASIDVTTLQDIDNGVYVILNASATTNLFGAGGPTFYYIGCYRVFGGDDSVQIHKVSGTTDTTLKTTSIGGELAAPYTCGGRRDEAGTLYAILNGTVITSIVDASFTNAGYTGLINDSTANLVMDNFQVGPQVIMRPSVQQVTGGSFLQIGAGYTGAPASVDSTKFYLYLMDSATISHVYLCRVARASLFVFSAYECVTAIDGSNNPTWGAFTSKISVLDGPAGHFQYGLMVSYNASLGRFIGSTIVGDAAPQTLELYEAVAPWGPFKTMYAGGLIDNVYKIMPSFPVKYFTDAGKTLWMVFSGQDVYDRANFVKVTLIPLRRHPPS